MHHPQSELDESDAAREAPSSDGCVSCGAPLTGPYCAACGESARRQDLTLRGVLTDALAAVTSLDSRGLRTFRTLFRKPGLLTAEYVAGRRRPYLSPIHTFLIANVLFFLAHEFGVPVVTFGWSLGAHLGSSSYGALAESQWEKRVAEQRRAGAAVEAELARDTSAAGRASYSRYMANNADRPVRERAALRARFDLASEQQAKSLVILLAPLFALAIALLRISRPEPAGQHMAFALHFLAFSMLLFVAVGVAILLVRTAVPGALSGDHPIIPVVVVGSMAAWVIGAFRTTYRSSTAGALVQGVLLALLFIPLLALFRFLLFFTVLYTV